jgi:hypothetical protein
VAPPKLCELSSQTRAPPAIVIHAPPQGGSAAATPQGSSSIITDHQSISSYSLVGRTLLSRGISSQSLFEVFSKALRQEPHLRPFQRSVFAIRTSVQSYVGNFSPYEARMVNHG